MRDGAMALTRRDVVAMSALAGGALLVGCGGGSSDNSSTAATTATEAETPTHGGTLTAAMIGAGLTENVNPATALNFPDIARVYNLFDRLFDVGPDVKTLTPGLAMSAEPSADAKTWTFELRDGVTWHDGKPFGADDVVWTMRSWSSPMHFAHPFVAGIVDFKGVRKRGPLTVEVPLVTPMAEFPALISSISFSIIQDGATTKQVSAKPVGTGPFTYVSFLPGKRSVFNANEAYWNGRPHVDKLVIDSSFTDENARVNALQAQAGGVNVVPIFPFLSAKQYAQSGDITVLRATSSQMYYFSMRVDKAPFDDPRVRQALRLLVDRPGMVAGVFNGLGTVANDLPGSMAPYFDASLVRERDVEQAQSLLKAAGQEGLTFELPTAPAGAGFVEAATIFAEQAKAAGVNVVVKSTNPATYFTPGGGWTVRPFGQNALVTWPSLTAVYRSMFIPGAVVNETKWGDVPENAGWEKLLGQATAELDSAKATELWKEVQQVQFDQGPLIGWGAGDYVDAVASDVRGLKTTAALYLNNFRFADGWIAR